MFLKEAYIYAACYIFDAMPRITCIYHAQEFKLSFSYFFGDMTRILYTAMLLIQNALERSLYICSISGAMTRITYLSCTGI